MAHCKFQRFLHCLLAFMYLCIFHWVSFILVLFEELKKRTIITKSGNNHLNKWENKKPLKFHNIIILMLIK
jgi:hypothetical protein